jgi:ADP-heptose:LPS heptosyltransferase
MIDMNKLRLLLPLEKLPWLTNFKEPSVIPRRILCMTAAGIGDVIMELPAICAVKQKYPNAQLTVLTHFNRGGNEICKLVPAIDETIDIGLHSYRWGSVIRFMLTRFWKLLFQLRKKNFDLAIVFWPNPVRKLLLAGLGSKFWIYSNLRGEFPSEQNRRLLQLLGIEITDKKPPFQIPVPPNHKQILPDNLPKPFIGVHPFCGMQWRQWSKFDELREQLTKLPGTVIVVGSKKDYRSTSPGLDLVNKLSIPELFWLIKQCDVFITADSGPMHISLAVGTPTVAIFGPVKPSLRISPQETTPHTILYRPSDESEKTAYAIQRKILTNEAMQSISVDEVLEATEKLLNKKSPLL